ncbi:LytTR family DNA-binding domain-containing protein [Chitinophaga horti]|uniref:LytTR family DNA-binding domain-containing protein n=1 Tax=Chitinophaga horti TaxID=2920382 RepID=A0ABY6J619_9BACT|nr:LytTR family DNA-binding domain-containing protein [Chitinophaga horti]UYQ94801.1 LytTR family DNA-binding domain-containing protein [Chitinophaga horti]
MSIKTVLIIDDEEASRSLIRQYLSAHPTLQILGECENGLEAVKAINLHKPHLVFLDVQMPGLNGFQVLHEISHVPLIIFTTAYDRFAIKAFELNAVDYLLKPYTRQRFDLAVEKARQRTDQHALYELASSLPVRQGTWPTRIFVELPGRLRSLDLHLVLYLKAEKEYTRIHTAQESYLSSQGINAMEKRLDPQRFMRVHRSFIVNIYHIKEVYRDISRTFILLNGGTEISVSRNYINHLKKLIY